MKKQTLIKTTVLMVTIAIGNFGSYHTTAQTPRDQTPHNTNESQSGDSGRQGASRCTTRYDRFRNRNTVTIDPQTIHRAGADELRLGASAVAEGEAGATPPREVDLIFDSTTSRLRYGNSAEVRFIVDERHIEGGTAYKFGGSAMRQVNEKMRLTMPASRYLEIISGRDVEMQIGETEVTLSREVLERLRGFAICAGLNVESRK